MPFDDPLPPFDVRADFWSLRFVEEICASYAVRKNVPLPYAAATDRGVMASVYADGGYGYAATSDTSAEGLKAALERATRWARATAKLSLIDSRTLPRPSPRGDYASPSLAAPTPSHREVFELLEAESRAAGGDSRIVDWEASLDVRSATHRLVTSEGGDVVQRFRFAYPSISVTAHADGDTQRRSLNGDRGICQQGALEILERFGFVGSGRRIAEEALELLAAPNCPSGTMDLLLLPDQMTLQIHESIGHPLELDRILGDERNFAGTSFVTPEMFGSYRYGSDLLNVTFDAARRARELRVRRRRHRGGTNVPDSQRHPGAAARRRDLASTRGASGRGQFARGQLEPPADRSNGEPQCRTQRRNTRRYDRRHRARHRHGNELLVVYRRLAQQIPVRLRARPADR
jgi:predicted Zn-dependent protease